MELGVRGATRTYAHGLPTRCEPSGPAGAPRSPVPVECGVHLVHRRPLGSPTWCSSCLAVPALCRGDAAAKAHAEATSIHVASRPSRHISMGQHQPGCLDPGPHERLGRPSVTPTAPAGSLPVRCRRRSSQFAARQRKSAASAVVGCGAVAVPAGALGLHEGSGPPVVVTGAGSAVRGAAQNAGEPGAGT